MDLGFTPKESSALYRLLAETTDDIILKTDPEGFILHASPGIARFGLAATETLVPPNIVDLARPDFVEAIRVEHRAALRGQRFGRWVEFAALTLDREERWFELQLRSLPNEAGGVYGALGVMRSIEERKSLEERLFAAAVTDPLTGLGNRKAFIASLRYLADSRRGGCVALFKIDYFRAMNMARGQAFGDEVLRVFSDMLRAMTRQQDLVARIGGENLGVLMPGAPVAEAVTIGREIVETLSEVSRAAGEDGFHLTASAGVAPIGRSLDRTMKRAELALYLAKAKGRNRLECDVAAGVVEQVR